VNAMVKIERKKARNNLDVVIAYRQAFSVAAELLILYGERNTKEEALHLLEHLLFKPEDKTFEIVKKAGGMLNAKTSQDSISIYFWMPAEHIQGGMKTLKFILLDSNKYWTDELIKTEKSILLQELREYWSQPEGMLNILFRRKLLGKDFPDTKDPSEIEEELKTVDLKYLRKILSELSPEISCLSVVGSVCSDINEWIAPVEEWKGVKVKIRKLEPKPEYGIHKFIKNLPTAYIRLGFITVPYNNEDNIYLKLLSSILAVFPTSRLYKKLRLERGLSYYVTASQHSSLDFGYFSISTATKLTKVDEVINIIFQELEKIIDEGVSEEELDEVKKWTIGSIKLLLDTLTSFASLIAEHTLIHNNPRYLFDVLIPKIKKAKIEDIQRIAKKYLQRDRCVICILS